MKKYKLGFIGCGNMAQAIIASLNDPTAKYLHKLNKLKFELFGFDTDADKLSAIPGLTPEADAKSLAEKSDIVVLSVKPQNAAQAVEGVCFDGKIVLSIMAGVTCEKLKALTKAEKTVRVMPNLNARVGASFSAYCPVGLDAEEERTVRLILDSFGRSMKTEESAMNAITGIAGSGPAFVFMFIKAFTDAGVKYGFDHDAARDMAVATIAGSAQTLAAAADTDIETLIDSVCSKGGTTIRGVDFLKEKDFEETVIGAIDKAAARAAEMERGE